MTRPRLGRAVVAMSGGVDSSVVAGLLHEAGHEVVGVTLQLYDHGASSGRKGACCAGEDVRDARRVADHLGVAHYVVDAQARFASAVIADFADSYAAGETPVPCVRCNQSVKFTDLAALARDLGAEFLATGHYVRRVDGPDGPELHRAADAARDQSWFLFATTREQLAFARFPLGGMSDKAAVRAEAARLGLRVAEKPDSQDICFVPSGHYSALVARLRPDAAEPGEIVDEDGAVLAAHAGIGRYTVGQGRRLGAAAAPGRAVTAIDPARRRIVVGPRTGGVTELRLREVNWLIEPPAQGRACTVRLRAGDAPREAVVQAAADGARVRLAAPALAAPGQACVFYDGGRVLGGGIMRRARQPSAPAPLVDAASGAAL
jgi:tRNA-specific 2-thiouridylase